MKILLVSSYLPYPLFSGGHIRLFNIIKELSKRHEITLICEKRNYQTQSDVEKISKLCKKVITVDRNKQWSLINILRAAFSLNPFLIVGHTNSLMKQEIINILHKDAFDIIHAETFYIMQNIPDANRPLVLAEHNIEYLVYKRYADLVPNLLKFFFYMDVWKLKRAEHLYWHRASKLIAVSKEEKELMERKDVEIVPNGVDLNTFKIQDFEFKHAQKQKRILFIGDFKWLQNRDAASWLIKSIWPEINQKSEISSQESLQLWIIGKKIPGSIRRLTSDPDIIFDENASEKTPEIFNKAYILVAPIRVGGGTSFKILESMASSVPVVTTNLGIEGIDAKNGQDVIVRETAHEIAEAVIDLLHNEKLYNNIARNARVLMEQKYSWSEIIKKLEKIYLSAVNK